LSLPEYRHVLKSLFNADNFIMQVVLVYLKPFHRKSFLKCALQPKIVKNSPKTHILGVQGHSRSSMLINLKKPITSACYDKQHVCTFLQPVSHYSSHGKMTSFLGGYPSLMPLFSGKPITQRHKILSR